MKNRAICLIFAVILAFAAPVSTSLAESDPEPYTLISIPWTFSDKTVNDAVYDASGIVLSEYGSTTVDQPLTFCGEKIILGFFYGEDNKGLTKIQLWMPSKELSVEYKSPTNDFFPDQTLTFSNILAHMITTYQGDCFTTIHITNSSILKAYRYASLPDDNLFYSARSLMVDGAKQVTISVYMNNFRLDYSMQKGGDFDNVTASVFFCARYVKFRLDPEMELFDAKAAGIAMPQDLGF